MNLSVEDSAMPNKTIYVTDADLPLFERAQELAGGNLSAAIAQALQRFVDAEGAKEAKEDEVGAITVKVGRNGAFIHKRFHGQHIAKQHVTTDNGSRQINYDVFLTARGNFAVHIRTAPNWAHWTTRRWGRHDRSGESWSAEDWTQHDARLEVYDSLEALKDNVPTELFEVVARVAGGNSTGIEDIDI
jgi:EXLDI family protein